MSKNPKIRLKAIYEFRSFLRDMWESTQNKVDKEKSGELKEFYKSAAFTYEQVIEELDRHFHLMPPYHPKGG